MRRLVGTIAACMLLSSGPALAADPQVGDAAPDFTLQGTDGSTHNLREYVGKKAVVIAWFPKAFTPG
ncbi:MAG: peroxiredoxin Q/BCP [Myxococcota bacterium]|jgi:peroxiredoxin Q/BCP